MDWQRIDSAIQVRLDRLKELRAHYIVGGLLLLVLGYAATRAALKNGPWFDESYSLLLVQYDLGEIVQRTAVDSHPPLWYFLAKIAASFGSHGMLAIRLESVAFMLAALAVWHRLIARRTSEWTATLTIALLAVNPTILHYGSEARMYAFGLFLVSISTWAMLFGRGWRALGAYWLLAVAMLYTHYFLLFIVGAQVLYLLVVRAERGLKTWHVIAFGASILAAFLPWIPVLLSRTQVTVEHGFWIGPLTPNAVLAYFLETFLRRIDWDLQGWRAIAGTMFCVVVILAIIRGARAGRPTLLFTLLCTVPPACLMLVSIKTPMFYPRYVIFGLPSLCALAAVGAVAHTGWRRLVIITVLLVGTLNGFTRELPRTAFRLNVMAHDLDRPIDGQRPPVVVCWYFALLDAKTALAEPSRVVEKRDVPPVHQIHEALFDDKRGWYIYYWDEITARHAWTIENAGGPVATPPSNWHEVESVRRGYVRARLWRIEP